MRRSIYPGLFALLLLLSGLTSVGCTSTSYSSSGPAKSQGHGPPPHAPAHGYRAKTAAGVELSFRSDLGVYVVVGATGHYYFDGVFYRQAKGKWTFGAGIDGPWKPASESKLPPGLRSKKSDKGKAKGHSKGT